MNKIFLVLVMISSSLYISCNRYYITGENHTVFIVDEDTKNIDKYESKTSEANSSTNAKVDDISKDLNVMKDEVTNIEGDLKKVKVKTEIVGKKVLGDSTANTIIDDELK